MQGKGPAGMQWVVVREGAVATTAQYSKPQHKITTPVVRYGSNPDTALILSFIQMKRFSNGSGGSSKERPKFHL